ncbi:MAG: VanZ family protein [Phycisphaeraceae bacterium]|nr:VanZ family protein [Phycisphaeraceae bacterium]
MLAYGTLTPFAINPEARNGKWLFNMVLSWIIEPRWDYRLHGDYSSLGFNNALNDIMINLALYAPLGLLIRLTLIKRKWSAGAHILGATLAAGLVSWLLEGCQNLTLDRIASLKDVVTNTAGGFVGALLAVWLRSVGIATVFFFYRKLAFPLYHTREWLARRRRHPAMAATVVMANIAILVWASMQWMNAAPARAHAAISSQGDAMIQWMPFAQQFSRSYDVAAVQLGRWLVIYVLVGALLSLGCVSVANRRGMGWLVFATALVAALNEAARLIFARTAADVTGPALAIIGALAVATTAFLLADAVSLACRRRVQVPVAVERRRIPHQYKQPA